MLPKAYRKKLSCLLFLMHSSDVHGIVQKMVGHDFFLREEMYLG